MKTKKQVISIKAMCAILILLTSASFVEAYPPDNAAVLYYRAFFIVKESSEDVTKMMDDMRKGKLKSNDKIRQHLEENRRAIELIETAAEIPTCEWGRDNSRGLDLLMPELAKVRRMAFLLTADAQTVAQDGDHRTALKKCLTLHKMARHVGDDLLISYLVGTSLSELSNKRIKEILSEMPDDVETLTWLKNQVFDMAGGTPSIKGAMNSERKLALQQIRKENVDTILDAMKNTEEGEALSAESIEKVRKADEEFLRESRQYYTDLVTRAQAALDLPYPQSHQKLQELSTKAKQDAAQRPAAILAAALSPAVAKLSSVEAKRRTFFNAIMTATDIYLVKAKTGRLPEKLGADMPRDLFSGKDFEYNKTKDGFTLSCRAKDLDKDEIYQYEFKIAK